MARLHIAASGMTFEIFYTILEARHGTPVCMGLRGGDEQTKHNLPHVIWVGGLAERS